MPIPVTVLFKAQVCGRSVVGIAVSNPVASVGYSSLVFVVCCVCSGLCDGLFTLSEEATECVCVSNFV